MNFTPAHVMQARRELAREYLIDFTAYTLPTYEPAPHHQMIAERLEAVERGDLTRLMIFMPPRHGKSELASRRFPAWFLGRNPDAEIIAASYNSDLAADFGREVRSILREDEYQELFKVSVRADSAAANRWHTDQGGAYRAAGVATAMTGRGADCLRGDTVIQTPQGLESIESLVMRAYSGNVLSYDKHSNRLVQRAVKAVARRSSPDFYRVVCKSGRVVEATGDHRFYTERGYVPARLLAQGDVLLSNVPVSNNAGGLLSAQVRAKRDLSELLRSRLPDGGPERSCGPSGNEVYRVRCLGSEKQASVFGGVQGGVVHQAAGELCSVDTGAGLRDMRQGVSPQDHEGSGTLLLSPMPASRALQGNDGEQQSCLEGWSDSSPNSRQSRDQGIPGGKAEDHGAGWWMRCLPNVGGSTGSPHRSGRDEQRGRQPCDVVQDASHAVPCCGEVEAQSDLVVLVERVCEPTDVFDLQVEGTECFFANGILVHNCLLIDDPVKDREEADSEIRRERVWDWYRSTAYTRLSKDGRIVLIQTRWHEDDLAGRILEQEGDEWEVLSLPAILDSGEPLWPERFNLERLASIRRTVGPREWSALYQQRPQPDEGTYFKREWFNRWEVKPNHLHVYMTSDHATKEGAGDFTVIRVWGVDPKGDLYMLDGHKAQDTTDVWMREAARLIKLWKPLCWFPENDHTWKAIEPFIRRFLRSQNTLCRIEPLPTGGGDKPTKARGFQAMASMGKVFLPLGLMGDQVIDEYLRFPAGKHDDEIDAGALIGKALMDAHPAIVPVKEQVHGPQDAYTRARERYDDNGDWMTA